MQTRAISLACGFSEEGDGGVPKLSTNHVRQRAEHLRLRVCQLEGCLSWGHGDTCSHYQEPERAGGLAETGVKPALGYKKARSTT